MTTTKKKKPAAPFPRIVLIHWNAAEAADRAGALGAAGFDVTTRADDRDGEGLKEIRHAPPAAVVISLDRLPSQGRAVAVWLRRNKSTRLTPIVFAGGDADRIERTREQLPDATFTTWRSLPAALRRSIAAPTPAAPVVPGTMAGYSGTPLPKKLGIKPDARVLLIDAPPGFEETLGELPSGTTLVRSSKSAVPTVLLFVRSQAGLAEKFLAAAGRLASPGALWIVWPKKSSPLAGDIGEIQIRAFGLARGFVDYKVCAVDIDWSGLAFARRKQ